MRLTTFLFIVAVVGVVWWWRRGSALEFAENAMKYLQCPTLSYWEYGHVVADFGEMLLADYSYSNGRTLARVFHLRRIDDGTWEIKEQIESQERQVRELKHAERLGFPLNET